jgi:hypothetical protein
MRVVQMVRDIRHGWGVSDETVRTVRTVTAIVPPAGEYLTAFSSR